jgi:hypothetical protein
VRVDSCEPPGLLCPRLSVLIRYKAHRSLEYSALLIDRARISPARATRLVATANALQETPRVARAWEEGTLAQDQVRQLLSAREQAPEIGDLRTPPPAE